MSEELDTTPIELEPSPAPTEGRTLQYIPGDFKIATKAGIGKDNRTDEKAVDVSIRWDALATEPMIYHCVKVELGRLVHRMFRVMSKTDATRFHTIRKTGKFVVKVSELFAGTRSEVRVVKEDISALDATALIGRLSPEQLAAIIALATAPPATPAK